VFTAASAAKVNKSAAVSALAVSGVVAVAVLDALRALLGGSRRSVEIAAKRGERWLKTTVKT
jgi:hypothetical protein